MNTNLMFFFVNKYIVFKFSLNYKIYFCKQFNNNKIQKQCYMVFIKTLQLHFRLI